MRKLLIAQLMLCFLSLPLLAQDIAVTGKVTSTEDGSQLPGVNVAIKGTSRGTSTNASGDYQLNAPAGSTLVFSFIGFITQEVKVGNQSTINVSMVSDAAQLQEVVVTALGIKRDAKSISFATQQVNAENLTVTRQPDAGNALAGKVAGLQVLSQAGAKLGSGAVVRIRGAASLVDKNPLYVIDGTPLSSDSGTPGSLDINSDDIENVSVLKGPNATALYGQRGDAGVIVITTKKGLNRKGIGVDINSTTTFEQVNIIPKYQNEYGGGGEPEWRTYTWASGNPVEWKALDGKRYHDYSDDASWGPRIDGGEYIPWYAWYPNSPYSFKTANYTAQPNNVRQYYNTGRTFNNSISLRGGGTGYNLRLSYTNLDQTGVIPNTALRRNYITASSTFDLGQHLTAGVNLNFTTERLQGDFNDGYGNYSGAGSFNQWFHRDLDMGIIKELRDLRTPIGALASWNHTNPTSTTNFNSTTFNKGNYWYNWYSYQDNINNVANRDRLFGDVNLTYKFNDHFRAQGWLRRNQRNSNNENKTPTIIETSGAQTGQKATYQTGQTLDREDNYEFLTTYDNRFGDFDLSANVGGNIRDNTFTTVTLSTNGGLFVPDLFTIGNSLQAFTQTNNRYRKTVRSVYGRASLGWRSLVYLEVTGRNDWSSALPANNNSYFYPSVGGSFVFSELTRESLPFLSFGKLRGSWAQVGSDLNPYQLSLNYAVDQAKYNGTNSLMTTPNLLPNAGIIPSLSSAYEAGVDLRFLKSRVGLAFTYYHENKINEILNVDVTSVSGFTQKVINAGRIERDGIELQLDGKPVVGKDFNWDMTLNFAVNTSRIISLAPGVNSIQATSATPFGQTAQSYSTNDAFNFAYIIHSTGVDNGGNNRWGQLRGNGIVYKDGQPVVNADGTYQFATNQYFGSVLPSFTGGFVNNLRYKDLTLAFSIDYQKGGKYFSLSNFWGTYSGLYAETAATNDKGKNVRDDVAQGGGVHVKGVNANGEAVDTYVAAYDYYHQFGNNSIIDKSVFDASYVKLREVSIGYRLPIKANKFVQSINLAVVARNPWLIYATNRNIDPSELSQRFGENGQQPGTRSLGFNIRLGL
ncbi:SusC/RagA family TonB-linked outer membrane protein [Spirosoma sp. RP8]|uniref:SusC/RagA family TonB-linked outer membrane protein n=1 Tax=Spirosoma liriopis TaxID=2937440 RepID=A0ABT0HGA4_9BACT|nr:SusC/RagA family TonB-linked outer membrane protein [Spirosoma liriopis]MCK8490718.1 SusC/RagA family TonB-linked outer membrane protein [Spirosoma liriopis]